MDLFLLLHLACSSLDLYKEFPEEAYSVALHPSGLYVLVGFSEKLRLMNLLIDDIRSFKEFMIRGCREVSWELAMGGTAGLQVSKICLEMMAGKSYLHCSTCTFHK